MSAANEATVLAFLKTFHEGNPPDFAALKRYLAPDAVYWSLVPSAVQIKGADAICAGIERQFGMYRDCTCQVHAIGSGGNHVFTERTDHVVLHHDSRTVSARLSAVFEIDGDGLISSWREYWDSEEVVRQMGVTRAEMEASIS
ncbi:nuclear transport factor 2 family protein [Sphingobium sp. CFD-1]|uniref:nuclear transport factor 2 family protein n=1 Tax=Sphingobium sp. CFD-1 TaxID=2878545 RepID=UPI00214AB468|nr:limonene-1,2-epoxide hydrolase family protein [Sphingobium sp. CFD-1]